MYSDISLKSSWPVDAATSNVRDAVTVEGSIFGLPIRIDWIARPGRARSIVPPEIDTMLSKEIKNKTITV